jgi:hypothetical protein
MEYGHSSIQDGSSPDPLDFISKLFSTRRFARLENRRRSLARRPCEPTGTWWLVRDSDAEAPLTYQRFRRQSLQQQHVLNRMVPVEDMDPTEMFQHFTELEPRQQCEPVTMPDPVRDLQKPYSRE